MNNDAGSRIAWITGASKGIGKALALRLAKNGWRIAASARTAGDLDALVTEQRELSISAYPLDVTDHKATWETLDRIESELGPISLAVLNAGTHMPMMADEFSIKKFRQLVETNLIGPANGLASLLPRMISQKAGQIAIVSSVAGYRGLPTSAGYGATKAGLINMCEALRPDLERHGIKLQVVNPGFVETPLTDRNDFPMPFLISADDAAARITRGLNGNAFEIAFPTRFVMLMKLLRLLPNGLYFSIVKRIMVQ